MTKRGRKPWIPTKHDLELAEILAGQGLNLEEIAHNLGISYQTLNEKKEFSEFSEAIKKGRSKGYAFATSKLFQLINAGNVAAKIFYLKAQHGWQENKPEPPQKPDLTPWLNALSVSLKLYGMIPKDISRAYATQGKETPVRAKTTLDRESREENITLGEIVRNRASQ